MTGITGTTRSIERSLLLKPVGHSRDEDNEAEERTVENAFKGKSVFVSFETAAK